MKATKVAIAAAAVAFMFLLVPFSTAGSDAAWGPNEEKSVYFESDSDKITWASYKEVTGYTDELLAKNILTVSGYEIEKNAYDYSGYEYSNVVLKGGKSAALLDKKETLEYTCVTSFDFKFTITAKVVTSELFIDGMTQQLSDLVSYLDLKDDKLNVGDKLEFSGTFSGDSANKSVRNYKDLDETEAALYYNELDNNTDMNVSFSVKFIRGDDTKDYEQEVSHIKRESKVESYEMSDDEKCVSKDKRYIETVTNSEKIVGSYVVKFDNKEITPTPTATLNSDNIVTYEKGSTIPRSDISDIKVDSDKITYKSWLNSSMDETPLKNKLETMGKLSSSYSDVDDVYEGIVNPSEPEETPVNQWLFFGAFIIILAIAAVVAILLREKNKA